MYDNMLVDMLSVIDRYEKSMSDTMDYETKSKHMDMQMQQLFKEYNQRLIDMGFGVKRSILKKHNIIDVRHLFSYQSDDKTMYPRNTKQYGEIVRDFAFEYDWLAHIPCFDKGVFHVNTNRYIYFELTNLDIDTKTIYVHLQDYIYYEHSIYSVWSPGITCDIELNIEKPDHTIKMTITNEQQYSDIYKLISPKDLHWSKQDTLLWNDVVIKSAEKTEKKSVTEETSNSIILFKYYDMFVMLTNYYLNLNKPKVDRKRSEPVRKTIGIVDESKQQTPRRLVRYVGDLTITSPKPPKQPTFESIRKYKVASWHCRGGVRRLKSGKLVPFKPSIHHRKCLQQDEQSEPIATTIKLNNKKGNNT